eukprot:15419476-Heterocapsa_arctica.AAC.1
MDFLEAVTKKERGKREIDMLKSTMETRTMKMDHIMGAKEIGALCQQVDTLDDFKLQKKDLCGNAASCLMCKGLKDVKGLDTYSEGYTTGMKRWTDVMQNNPEWQTATTRKKCFMVCTQLSTTAMKQERKDVSQYGAVRMSKEETNEMVRTNQ